MRRVQITAALIHLVVFGWCLYMALTASADALFPAVWFPLFWPDLPATAVMIATWAVVPDDLARAIDGNVSTIFPSHPFRSFWNFWYPVALYGVLGTIWWYWVPRLFSSLARVFKLAIRRGATTSR